MPSRHNFELLLSSQFFSYNCLGWPLAVGLAQTALRDKFWTLKQFKIMAGWHTVSSLLWLHKTLVLNQNHKKTYFIRHRLCHFLSTKYTILYGMHKSALTLGQIHLPFTNGPSVKCVNKKTFCFFIRIQ